MTRGKKLLIVLLIILALVGGAAFVCERMRISPAALFSGSRGVMISEDDYDYYQYLDAQYGKADGIRQFITENFYKEVDQEQLDDAILHGMFDGLGDIYSAYFNAQEYEEYRISSTGEYSGVGITMQAASNGLIEVVSITKNSPAASSPVRKGDYIIRVDGREFDGSTMDLCASSIRGKAGTKVTVTFYRNGEEYDYTFTRAKIVNPTVESEMLAYGIGYILISGFESNTAADFRSALLDLQSRGAKAFVLDLRDNPGGWVDSAIDIADMLMDEATMIYIEDQKGEREYYYTENGKLCELPFAVLVNDGSASSSEIFSAGIQDNGVAKIIGTQTFGKGIIQYIDELRDGSAIKLTMWQYFSPAGHPIHGVGITPDYVVELEESDFDENGELVNDRQLKKAIELLR